MKLQVSKKIILVYHAFCAGETSSGNENYFGRQGAVPIATLRKQLSWLSEFADFVTLDKILCSGPTDTWQVAVTMDDGYRNNLSLALPVFEQFEVPVTWFVTTQFVKEDILPWWDLVDFAVRVVQPELSIDPGPGCVSFDLTDPSDQKDFRSRSKRWFLEASPEVADRVRRDIEAGIPGEIPSNAFAQPSEIKNACSSPWLDLGAHTVTHPNLARQSSQDVRREMKEGKEKLESWTNQPVDWFAYPYGGRAHWDNCTKRIAFEEGFDGAMTTVRAYADQRKDLFEVPRLTVPNTRALWKTKAWILATNTCREVFQLKQEWIG